MVAIRRYLAPLTRTSGRGNTKKYITIHETANRGKGANANAHSRLQAGTNSRDASWHYQVDSTEIVQSFDDDVRCWHAGTTANQESIAIEICVNSDGDYAQAVANAAGLVAHLRKKHDIPWNRVVSHKFWTGKNCPTIMLGTKGAWDAFVKAATPDATPAATPPASKPVVRPASTTTPKPGAWPGTALPVNGERTQAWHDAWVTLMTSIGWTNTRLGVNLQSWLNSVKDPRTGKGYYPVPPYKHDGVIGPASIKGLQRFLYDRKDGNGKRFYNGKSDGIRGPLMIQGEKRYLNYQIQFQK